MGFLGSSRAAIRRALSLLFACAATLGAAAAFAPSSAGADNIWLYSCGWWGSGAPAFGASWGTQYLYPSNDCEQAHKALEVDTAGLSVAPHALASWYTNSPGGVSIDYAYTPGNSMLVSCGLNAAGLQAWWAANGWQGRIAQPSSCYKGMGDDGEINGPVPPGHSFQFYVWCANGSSDCQTLYTPALEVQGIELGATETSSPSLTALGSTNLYYEGGRWVRGEGWPISLQASDPTGACDMRAWVNGGLVQGPRTGLDQTVWDQCDPSAASQRWYASIDTRGYANGSALQLSFQAENAAGKWSSSAASTSDVDNAPVKLALSGPTDAPTTAGTQYVVATASAGPSGVGSIKCSVDGSAWSAEQISGAGMPTASAQIPVSGLGSHQVVCHASNRAIDPSGAVATSVPQTWSIKIGEPVIAGISFSKVVRHCQRVRERVKTPAHWVTVRRHHKLIRIRVPAKTRREWVTRCKVHAIPHAAKRVGFGRGATVSGWLSTANGIAVAGAPVSIMTAADNGLDRWKRMAVVTTSSDGGWTARLPAGPSRLIEAVYPGGNLTESATSRIVRLNVPARITMSISPRMVPWSQAITIRGRLRGGYVPHDGVALRLLIRYTGSPEPTVLQGFRTSRAGAFRITFAFGAGHGVETLPIWVATTASESDYPFAASGSKRIFVTFGG